MPRKKRPPTASEMGKKGGKKGGKARQAQLTPEERKALGRKGGLAHWHGKKKNNDEQ